jgi:hypothetical protein
MRTLVRGAGTVARTDETRGVIFMKKLIMIGSAAIAALAVAASIATAAQPPNPVPGPPVGYACEADGEVGIWDDQYFPDDPPICDVAEETFTLCLQLGEFEVRTPSVDDFAASIVEQYLGAGASASIGKCFKVVPRMFWLCYGTAANSLGVYDTTNAVKGLADGLRVPHASRTTVTGVKVGGYYLTCNDEGQKPTGKVVSTGNGGEVVTGPPQVGAGLLVSNPLDYTVEIA